MIMRLCGWGLKALEKEPYPVIDEAADGKNLMAALKNTPTRPPF